MNYNRNNKKGSLFVISAPSGAGKTSVAMAVLKECSPVMNIEKVVTYTSRPPRPGEIDGKDYHFLSAESFFSRQIQGFFLETTEYAGNYYGSPASILGDLEKGKSFLMVTDRPGALVIKNLIPKAILIWLYVKDLETLRTRLKARGTDSQETIDRRILIAEKELSQEALEGIFDHRIENDQFEKTVSIVREIILRS